MIVSNAHIDIEINPDFIQEAAYKSPSGCDCLFVKLNDYIGIKLYRNKCIRDSSYELQSLAASYGLGPDTFGTIDNLNINALRYQNLQGESQFKFDSIFQFGYLSEVVRPLSDNTNDCNDEDSRFFIDNIHELSRQLSECIDFDFGDNHIGNTGEKNGQLVCIDFGG